MQQRAVVLYDNTSGTSGTVTLSESAANFDYLEIFYSKWGSYYTSTKVQNPDGKTASLTLGYYSNANSSNHFHQILSTIVSISGTNISVVSSDTGLTNLQYNNTHGLFNNNEIYIYKVIGHR